MPTVEVGAQASRTRTVTAEDVEAFADVTHDTNPVHLDDEYAAQTQFGRRIAHGIFSLGLISTILGNDLPGEGSIYMKQEIQFKAPVYIGDTITATVECVKYRADKRIATFKTTVTNQDERVVLTGEAVVIAPASD